MLGPGDAPVDEADVSPAPVGLTNRDYPVRVHDRTHSLTGAVKGEWVGPPGPWGCERGL